MSDKSTLQKIEILSLDLLNTHQSEIGIVEQAQKYFNADMGWHYYLDFAWIIRNISILPRGSLLLDAGAGSGLLQFILSDLGYDVISADFTNRKFSSKHLGRYANRIRNLNNRNQIFDNPYTRHLNAAYNVKGAGKLHLLSKLFTRYGKNKAFKGLTDQVMFPSCEHADNPFFKRETDENCGRIFLYKCDVKHMPLLPDDFVDAVVSVSALEHNDHKDFEKCIDELHRVTKPSGRIAVTVSASQSEDWFHEPSKGWCYSAGSLKRLFRLSENISSNFQMKDVFFEQLKKEGNELHKRLSPFYFKSGDNGMPWGKWDPKYQPVGIIKIKNETRSM